MHRAFIQIVVVPVLFTALISGCAGSGAVGTLRFNNQAPVWQVNDRDDVAVKPADRPVVELLYHVDQLAFDRITDVFEIPAPRRAMNTNSLGEVPDSTWFNNRIGVRALSSDEVARGPNVDDGPDPTGPWQIISSKVGGVSVGFIIKDQRGVRFLLKFDEPDAPIIETATDVVVQRLLWALGYNVPEDTVVYFDRSQLVLAPDAAVKDVFGNKTPMTEDALERALAQVHSENGRFRGLASKFVPGIPIGGFSQRGVRKDDPNDKIPHEHRREVRGLYVFYAWLQYTDTKENNTLDVWEADPADPDRHYVVHYLVDFGKSLGAHGSLNHFAPDGHEYVLDIFDLPLSLFDFGLSKRSWEGRREPKIEGVGLFDAEHFEPAGFKSHDPYTPFARMDNYDAFWAAKILIRLTREQIRAAVMQGKYPDERAVEYLTDTLVARQRKTARYWFERVNALADFEIIAESSDTPGRYRLCFRDLLRAYKLESVPARTSYDVASYDFDGRELSWTARQQTSEQGRVCMTGLVPGKSHDGYTIVRIDTHRGAEVYAPVLVHLATDPATGRLRVIGLDRQ